MNDQKIFDLELTPEQWIAYLDRVEQLLEERRRNGSLLSSFDLIAGASILFFASGNNAKMPAKWVFAGVRDGILPDGILEKAQRLEQRLKDMEVQLQDVDELAETVAHMQNSIAELRERIRETFTGHRDTLKGADENAFTPKLEAR